jgi:hypothetical protein
MRPRKAITQNHLDDAGTVDHRYGHLMAPLPAISKRRVRQF